MSTIGDGLGSKLTGLFGAGAIAAGFSKLLAYGEKIKNQAEGLGVTTDFLQGFNKAANDSAVSTEKAGKGMQTFVDAIGAAREGSADAVGKFSKLGVTINNLDGSAKNSEEVFYAVADSIKSIQDPSARMNAVFEIFGKKVGPEMVNVLMRGGDGLRQFIEEANKLDELDIAELDNAKQQLDDLGNSAIVTAGKALAALPKISKMLGALFGGGNSQGGKFGKGRWAAMLGAMDDDGMANTKSGAGEADRMIAQAKELHTLTDAIAKLKHKAKDEDNQELDLMVQTSELQKKFNAAKDGTIEKYRIEKDLLEKQAELTSLKEKREKKFADDKAKADKEAADLKEKALKKELRATEKRNDLIARGRDILSQYDDAKRDRLRPDLNEFAEEGRRRIGAAMRRRGRSGWNNNGYYLTTEQRAAMQIEDLESGSKMARLNGNEKWADELQRRAESIRKATPNLKLSDKDPYAQMNQQLGDILLQLSEKGIVVNKLAMAK